MMDFRLLCVLLSSVLWSYANSCQIDYDDKICVYNVTCIDVIGYIDWSTFSRPPIMYPPEFEEIPDSQPCQQSVSYGPYSVYPIYVVFKHKMSGHLMSMPIYESRGRRNDQFIQLIYGLDLSDNSYNETPLIKSMENLAVLNISRNQLTTAVLSNVNELKMLTEIDLSYNTINDIQVKSNEYLYKKLKKIDISHNYLVKIPDAIFDELDDLQILDLSSNYIDILGQFTFEGIKKLLILNLANNRLTDINSSFFRFSELKILNLSGNRIKDIKLNDLNPLLKLEELDLSSNNIKTMLPNIFDTMILLKRLDLSNNQLEIFNKNTFSGLQSLNNIDLSKNIFTSLPKYLFRNMSILTFSITENRLEGSLTKGMFEGIDVTMLDLSNQFLTEIEDYAFSEVFRLDTLLLSSNNIQLLSKMCFSSLKNLGLLDMSNNQITDINFDKTDLSNLKSLLLKNNRLAEIKYEHLEHLNSLEFLDLSGNQISKLDAGSFQFLGNLINLVINNNPITGILETGTFNGLVSLPTLDMSRTMLTTVQNASFTDMRNLKDLNMSSCNISELQFNTFIRTGYIETLDLSYNKLEEFSINTTDLVGLFTLLLNNNLIKAISSSSLTQLPRLNKIVLSYNDIKTLGNDSFKSLIDLRHLDLSYNKKINFTATVLHKNLHTLILSGIKTPINFAHNTKDISITNLGISDADVQNISRLNLRKIDPLDVLDLSYNNVTQLLMGDFTGVRSLTELDLSFNKISYIQPGVFKDNMLLHSLNVSHNHLSSVSYGIFRGLIYLSILDMSYNNINDLQSERFYEVKSLSQLIVDHNKIDMINAEEFEGTSLSKLSIGDNPLPCSILVRLQKRGVPFEITAIKMDENSIENVNGVTCNKVHKSEITVKSDKTNDNYSIVIDELRNILNNLSIQYNGEDKKGVLYLEKISNILEKSNSIYDEKLTNLANLTSEVIDINNNTNDMLNKLIKSLSQTTQSVSTTDRKTSANIITTNAPLIVNDTNIKPTIDVISYINDIKKELINSLAIEKKNIISEIESKLTMHSYQTESLPTSIGHEKLVSSNESTKSLFTETCVALILLILVGFVLYKFYKSRMFIRNRFSISTRELPGAMENSTL